jgi:serine/threonine-protein kinase
VLRRVGAGEFAPPRWVDPAVPPALEAVCRKAMALRPEDRYGSPRALAEDLEHWLADEPVRAYPDPWPARAARWGRRHRPLVAGAAALLLTATAALAVSNVLVGNARNRAERALDEADASFRLAVQATDEMLTKVAEAKLPNIPNVETLRRDLIERSLAFNRVFLEKRPRDPVVRNNAAKVFRRAANTYRLIAEKTNEALGLYLQALDLLRGLVVEYPGELKYRDLLAETHVDTAELLKANGRIRDALPHYRSAVQIARALRDMAPNNPSYRRTQATTFVNIAEVLTDTGLPDEARGLLEDSIGLLAPLLSTDRPVPSDHWFLAMAHRDLGVVLGELGQVDGAEQALGEAVRLMTEREKSKPDDVNAKYLHATASCQLGRLLGAQPSRRGEAERALDDAVSLLTGLVNDNRKIPHFRLQLAVARSARGRIRSEAGAAPAAEEDLEAARAGLDELFASSPATPGYHAQLGQTLGELGRLALARRQNDRARDLFTKAVSHGQIARDANPDNPAVRNALERDREGLRRAHDAAR